jgi:hypothetical protein
MLDLSDVDFATVPPDELEFFIKHLGALVLQHHQNAQQSRQQARECAELVSKAVAARSPEVVAQLERELSL